jgi:hypothetical protein
MKRRRLKTVHRGRSKKSPDDLRAYWQEKKAASRARLAAGIRHVPSGLTRKRYAARWKMIDKYGDASIAQAMLKARKFLALTCPTKPNPDP